MKICIVSVGSGEAELERERDTMLSAWEVVERELVVVGWFVVVLRVLADGCGLVMGSRVELRGRRLSNKVSEVARFGVTRWLFVMLRFMRWQRCRIMKLGFEDDGRSRSENQYLFFSVGEANGDYERERWKGREGG